jgi:hypothetical protein
MGRTLRASRQDTPNDVGTLWTMQRRGTRARCALMAWPSEWELRVLVDGKPLLEERCARADDAFALADTWKRRMREQGWQQIVPQPGNRAPSGDHQSA